MSRSDAARGLPNDIVLVLILTVSATVAAVAPVVSDSPLRFVLGLVYILFAPGYVLTAILFPRRSDPVSYENEGLLGPVDRNFTGLERGTLSVGLSIAIVALLGLILDASPFPLALTPLLLVLGGFTVLGAALATRRRLQQPVENRFVLDVRSWWRGVTARSAEIRSDRIINALLLLSVLLASASIAYAATTPREDEEYTRFYLLSESGEDELVADNYTTGTDGAGEVIVGIENHEYERTNYTTVVTLQRLASDDTTATVNSSREILRYGTTLPHGGTERTRVTVPSVDRNGSYRLEFLLYRGEIPEDPTPENAYRHTHLLLNGSRSAGAEGVAADV